MWINKKRGSTEKLKKKYSAEKFLHCYLGYMLIVFFSWNSRLSLRKGNNLRWRQCSRQTTQSSSFIEFCNEQICFSILKLSSLKVILYNCNHSFGVIPLLPQSIEGIIITHPHMVINFALFHQACSAVGFNIHLFWFAFPSLWLSPVNLQDKIFVLHFVWSVFFYMSDEGDSTSNYATIDIVLGLLGACQPHCHLHVKIQQRGC